MSDNDEQKPEHFVTRRFSASGTTCQNCAELIKRQALKVDGVKSAHFDYPSETGSVTYDPSKTDFDAILYKIEEKGYTCFILDEKSSQSKQSLGWIFGILGLLVVGYFAIGLIHNVQIPQITQNMGYGLLFVVGLLTGFHCIAMCGGFVVGYTAKDTQQGKSSHLSHLWYGTGKVISYTIIGAAFGLLGSIIAFTPTMRGIAGIVAGIFLVIFGLRMLNVFPVLRKFQFKAPGFISRITGGKSNSPLVVGLLNGLMIACGPLQAIYIMAAGTGSLIEGAKLLFIFALGTLPVMLGFGYFTSFVSGKLTAKILKASGAVVILLGLMMLNNGLVLTGAGYDFKSIVGTDTPAIQSVSAAPLSQGFQEIHMTVDANGFTPSSFVLQKGVPVKWIIDGKQITSCNKAIQVPAYGLQFDIKPGLQTIEFTPTDVGTIRWSCWMGMIHGTFIVKDQVTAADQAAVAQAATAPSGAGTCNMGSGGGCGCGMMN
ncbi:MAG: sulfite exporter TauE/SafE family protein [Candidatus Woesearchaeota archaeon]